MKMGTLSFSSNGSNNLKNTNNLKTSITNNFNYTTSDYFYKKMVL